MSGDFWISDQELHAFIDGELPPDRAARIARLIESDAVLAAQVRTFYADKNQLAQLHAEELGRPLPAKWLHLIEEWANGVSPVDARAGLAKRRTLAIAASLLLILGLGLLVQHFLAPGEDAIIAEALAARQQTMPSAQVFAADALSGEDRRNQILTAALEMPLQAPDLEKMGYRLDEVRVYSGVPGGKAVGLSYRDAQMRLFTLYLRHPSSPPRVDLYQREGVRICIWQDDVLGTVMLGEMSAAAMARIASLAYSGLNL